MKIQIKYDIHRACRIILRECLQSAGISFTTSDLGEIELNAPLTDKQQSTLEESLKKYGIEIIDNPKHILVQQIKDLITDLVYDDEKHPETTLSSYIADKLNLSYSYLSKIFTEEMQVSIENYMIQQRVERVKQLIIENEHTLTEMAWKLNYSSVAHLSNQFKKTTGLTPTMFQQIIHRRNSNEFPRKYAKLKNQKKLNGQFDDNAEWIVTQKTNDQQRYL
jgi:AraC-like DNA-binding protein